MICASDSRRHATTEEQHMMVGKEKRCLIPVMMHSRCIFVPHDLAIYVYLQCSFVIFLFHAVAAACSIRKGGRSRRQ